MATVVNAGKKSIEIVSAILNITVLIVILLALAFGCYAIWDSHFVTKSALAVEYEMYKPADDGGLTFKELQAINPEVVGWLTVYGTNIDYPVVQSDNNWKYINTRRQGAGIH